MPFAYSRKLTGNLRSKEGNRHLGFILAFVAGLINAGGFLAVHQYTSHMTGIVSAMADHLALGMYGLVFAGFGALLSFLLGAASTAVMINYARRHHQLTEFAFPLLVEAALLLVFGLLGAQLSSIHGLFVPITVMLLCFIMGLQNAVITKISKAEIRTTHITGIITDIGIELGKLFYWNRHKEWAEPLVDANHDRLKVLCSLAGLFFSGGVVGALGFHYMGYLTTLPIAAVLLFLAIAPTIDAWKDWRQK